MERTLLRTFALLLLLLVPLAGCSFGYDERVYTSSGEGGDRD
jgi:hypothetical protein